MENGEDTKVLRGQKIYLCKGQGVCSSKILLMILHTVVWDRVMCMCEQLCMCMPVGEGIYVCT